MAQVIGAYLKQAYATCHTQDMPFLKDAATFNFHGYCGYDFRFEGVNCKIVKPYGEAPGNRGSSGHVSGGMNRKRISHCWNMVFILCIVTWPTCMVVLKP